MNESMFFQDLAVLMSLAGVVAVIFSRLGWPKVLGYILVGILMNGHTWGGSFLRDADSVQILGQLGIVFLMYGMGLNFSAKDMSKIKSVALPAAIVDVVVMTWLGYTVGTQFLGWNMIPSLFLGVAICDSATTLLAKVIDEMGWGKRTFTKYVLGTSVCEDIICVGAIAVATGCAHGGGMSLMAFAGSLGKLALFFLGVLVFGLLLLPRLVQSIGRRHDDEAMVLAVLGCCFLVSFFAYTYDFSLAMGAFLVGLLGASSEYRAKLDALTTPMKSMFSAMFFVTIGLLVDPGALWKFLPQILLVSGVVIVGKFLNTSLVSLAMGLDLKSAIQTGFSLAQIGEFAFMTAILYNGLAPNDKTPMFPIAIGVSLLTTLLNPLMIKVSDKAGNFTVRKMPKRVTTWLRNYHAWLEKIRASKDSPAFALAKRALRRIAVYAALIVVVTTVTHLASEVNYSRFSEVFERHDKWFFFALANLFVVGMLPLVISAARSLGDEVAEMLFGESGSKWQLPMLRLMRFAVTVVVSVAFFMEWTMINVTIAPEKGSWVTIFVAVGMVLIGIIGWNFFLRTGRKAVQQFTEALTAEERREGISRTITLSLEEAGVSRIRVPEGSSFVGQSILQLDLRKRTGATVVTVYRDGKPNRHISPNWVFQADDEIVVLGEAESVTALKRELGC